MVSLGFFDWVVQRTRLMCVMHIKCVSHVLPFIGNLICITILSAADGRKYEMQLQYGYNLHLFV